MADKNTTDDSKKKIKSAKERLDQKILQAKRYLFGQKFQLAITTAHDAIKAQKDQVGGQDSVHLLPGYFILVESLMADGKIKKAQEFLIGAYWNFQKSQVSDDKKSKDGQQNKAQVTKAQLLGYRIQLDRTFAKLFHKLGNYQQARNKLKTAILLQSGRFGPEHPCTGLNYFLMGNIFQGISLHQQSQLHKADSYYCKFVEIWYKYLKSRFKQGKQGEEQIINEIHLGEALTSFLKIQKIWESRYVGDRISKIAYPMIRLYHSLFLLYHMFEQKDHTKIYLENALRVAGKYLGKNHRKTLKLQTELRMIFEQQNDFGEQAYEDGQNQDEQNQ